MIVSSAYSNRNNLKNTSIYQTVDEIEKYMYDHYTHKIDSVIEKNWN